MLLDKGMHIAAHAVEALMAEGEHRFRRVEGLARCKRPFKFERVDAVLHAHHPVRRYLRAADVVAGIDEVEAPALPRLLVAALFPDGKKGIVAVGARAADGADGALPRREPVLMLIPLANPGAVEGEHRIIPRGQVDLHAHQGMDFDLLFPLIDQPRAAGDHIALLKHGVKQMQLRTKRRILQNDCERFAPPIAGGEAGKLRLGISDLCIQEFEIAVEIPVFGLYLHGGQTVIALAEFRIVEPDMIERQMILFIIDGGVAVACGMLITEKRIVPACRDTPPVIKLLELAAGQSAEEIARLFRG